jgi:dipeptidyl aminopeptidase/acylaminoacyl peptidase
MRDDLTHEISRNRLLGDEYSESDVTAHSAELNVRVGMPPVFLLHSVDDTSVPVGNSLEMFTALRQANVPAELHLYADGGHGFGLRYTKGKSVEAWPQPFYDWIRFQTGTNTQ